jgi:hypothetical protein
MAVGLSYSRPSLPFWLLTKALELVDAPEWSYGRYDEGCDNVGRHAPGNGTRIHGEILGPGTRGAGEAPANARARSTPSGRSLFDALKAGWSAKELWLSSFGWILSWILRPRRHSDYEECFLVPTHR